jgi:hypothetical protein
MSCVYNLIPSLQVRSTDTYTLCNKDSPFHEIDIGEHENLQQAISQQWMPAPGNGYAVVACAHG